MDIKRFIPSNLNRRIELQLFEITLLLTLFVFTFWSITAFISGYNEIIKAIYSVALVVYVCIYIMYKRGVSFTIISILYYAVAFSLLVVGWLPSGGITGAIVHFFSLVFISGLLVLPLRAYLLFILATTSVVIGYSIYEYNYPEAAVYYTVRLNQIRDLSISAVLMMILIGVALYVFKGSHYKDRHQLKRVINKLGKEMEKAASADRAKTKFLATISHEMRTPLNGIIGLSELLGHTKLNQEQKEMLGSLIYSSDLLHSLISDVLDLTLIEDNKLVLHQNEVEIKKEMGEVLEMFKRRLDSKSGNIELSYDHDQDIPLNLSNDITRFRQIIINLINNAIKFTFEGYVVVKSELKELSGKEAWIQFSVSDTGTGIQESKQKDVFKKFYKANEDQTIEGTGLGLSICKNLVEAMGGKIDFESEEGVGSIFYFEIPFTRSSKASTNENDSVEADSYFKELKVLVAEDVKINQMVISKMLKNLGVKSFDVVENGKEAVNKANSNDYDFVLMDVQMPVMNGIEAAAKILKNDTGKKPVIVAVTANVMSGEKEECKNAGMSDFISKPITSEMLKDVFNKYT